MELSNSYNKLACEYESINQNGFTQKARIIALKQLSEINWNNKHILDFGVGPGLFLLNLFRKYPNALLSGIDVSSKMLELSKSKLALTTYQIEIEKACTILPRNYYDLIIGHFILSYVGLETMLNEAYILSRKDGYVSLITSTFEDFFPKMHQVILEEANKKNFMGKTTALFYKIFLNRNKIPQSLQEIKGIIQSKSYNIVKYETLHHAFYFENAISIVKLGINGGWLNLTFSLPLHMRIYRFLFLHFFKKIYKFPIEDSIKIKIFLLKKI